MGKTIIVEGKTSTEAIEKGLKELNVSKDKVDIKVLENEDKRSFFSILSPRIVKVEMTLKEGIEVKKEEKEPVKKSHFNEPKKVKLKPEEIEIVKQNLTTFLKEFTTSAKLEYELSFDNEYVYVAIEGEDAGSFIGYRGETLNAMQTILSSIANKNLESKAHIILNIAHYREKRQKALEELADKLSKTVMKTGKQVTLEPMSAYERKIIHNRLQSNDIVKTYSVGEEPHRKVVITKK